MSTLESGAFPRPPPRPPNFLNKFANGSGVFKANRLSQDVDSSKMFLEQASTLYDRCTNGTLTSCQLLYFAFADFEEQRRNYDKVRRQLPRVFERRFLGISREFFFGFVRTNDLRIFFTGPIVWFFNLKKCLPPFWGLAITASVNL